MTRILILLCLIGLPAQAYAEEAEGTFSLVTNPPVMVYLDGSRVGMSPIINRRLAPGEHRVALLLILPNGNRLRADYRVMIEAGRETSASLNLASDAPSEGEVRTIAPAPAAPPPPPPPPQTPPPPPTGNPNPPAGNPQTGGGSWGPNPNAGAQAPGGSWATNPGRPTHAPVTVSPPPQTPPPAPATPPPPPEPDRGLSRAMVREGLEALRPVVLRCMRGATGVVSVRMVIQPDGGVADVEAQGSYRGTRAGECIEQAFPEEAAFPIYDGEPIPVVYPFRVAPPE